MVARWAPRRAGSPTMPSRPATPTSTLWPFSSGATWETSRLRGSRRSGISAPARGGPASAPARRAGGGSPARRSRRAARRRGAGCGWRIAGSTCGPPRFWREHSHLSATRGRWRAGDASICTAPGAGIGKESDRSSHSVAGGRKGIGPPLTSPQVGDLTRWKNHDAYQKALDRLLRDLRVEKA